MTSQKDSRIIREELCQFARSNLMAEGKELSENGALAEAGIDSFSLVELLLYSERAFGVSVPESHLTQANLTSVAALAECIAGLARQAATQPPAAP
jgi:acyl carrier protein